MQGLVEDRDKPRFTAHIKFCELRVRGCAGMAYTMEYAEKVEPWDGAESVKQLRPRELLVLARRTAQRVQKDASTTAKRLNLCRRLLQSNRPDPRLETLRQQLSRLPKDERHYWIGTFYALLLPAPERRSKATYFTPPHLARSIVALAC